MKPDYGLDAPKVLRQLAIRGALFLVIGVVGSVFVPESLPEQAVMLRKIGLWAGGSHFLVALFMVWSSKVGKFWIRDRLLGLVKWRGDEQVLDVGCGRGLMLIGAAEKLRSGVATGIDVWSGADLSENSPEATMGNAKAAGVAERVRIETGDARELPYAAATFDVVFSMTAIHNIGDRAGRQKAIREMYRVLKPGGRLALFDIFHAGQYVENLEALGARDLAKSALILLWCVPGRIVTAVKE